MKDEFSTKDFILGTIIGGLAGAVAALLLAPKSGREIRGDLNEGAVQLKDRANDWVQIAQEKGSDLKDKAYTTSSEIKQKAMDTTSQAVKVATDQAKGAAEKAKQVADQAKEAADQVKSVSDDVQEDVEQNATEEKSESEK